MYTRDEETLYTLKFKTNIIIFLL